jgi:hypothetical protein
VHPLHVCSCMVARHCWKSGQLTVRRSLTAQSLLLVFHEGNQTHSQHIGRAYSKFSNLSYLFIYSCVAERLRMLVAPPHSLALHVVFADTMGTFRRQLAGLPCVVAVIGPRDQDKAKLEYIRALGTSGTVAVGNGQNDRLMSARRRHRAVQPGARAPASPAATAPPPAEPDAPKARPQASGDGWP